MGIFTSNKKKAKDTIDKYFKEKNISLELKGDNYSFEIVNQKEGFSLYPYFSYNEGTNDFSFLVNLKKIEDTYDYKKLNEFNKNSKYLKAMVKDSIIYLEYNAKIDYSEFKTIMDLLIESVFIKSSEIDSL